MAEGDVKARLYEVALEQMGRRGIASTSTREIIAAAGVRNPSAISYHFGSKAGLADALAGEVRVGILQLLRRQTELTTGGAVPTVIEWLAPVLDGAIEQLASERGCLLARLWWEYDGYLDPISLEALLSGPTEEAIAWRAAIGIALPQFPGQIGLARNVAVLRNVGWMVARMAAIDLADDPFPKRDHSRFRLWLAEIAVALLTAPTALTDYDIRPPEPR